DNGYLTDVRTAAAGTIAAKYMANEDLEAVGVIGAGAQAEYQLEALLHVRDFHVVHVFSKTKKRLENFKEVVEKRLGVEVVIEDNAESVVKNSEVLITATPAVDPIVK